jgi:AcrR family transcriptional regulator
VPTRSAKKTYDASGRRREAERNRQGVIRVAHRLFLEQGYAATPLKQIADDAGVSLATIYAVFGNKRALLFAVFEAARRNTAQREADFDTPLEEQSNLTADLIAHRVCLTREGGAPVTRIIDRAAAADAEIAELWRDIQSERHERMTSLVRALRNQDLLQTSLAEAEAADALWTLTSNEVYGLLVLDRGWTRTRYERWLSDMLATSLFRKT